MSEKLKTPAPSWKQILSIPKTPFLFSTPFIGVVILLAYIIGILG